VGAGGQRWPVAGGMGALTPLETTKEARALMHFPTTGAWGMGMQTRTTMGRSYSYRIRMDELVHAAAAAIVRPPPMGM